MLANILVAVGLVLQLAIAVVLVRKHLRTRDVGLVWLGVAVVIWPLVSRLLEHGESVLIDRLVRGQSVGYFPFSLVERGQITIGGLFTSLNLLQQLVGIGLLLVAALYLYKTRRQQSTGYSPINRAKLPTTADSVNRICVQWQRRRYAAVSLL